MAEPPELPLVGDEVGGYRLRSVLGRGGMSVVFRAENPRLGSVIALKVLAPELATDDAFRDRFLEEARIAAQLNHPNVIPVYDAGSCGGLPYIAMRHVSGTDLRQVIKKRGRVAPGTAVFLLAQAARALDTAHRHGLVHRDVKPGNLMLEHGDQDDPDHVYLTDFGISKHVTSRSGLTSSGQFLGTIDYVAPEQIQGLPVTGQADQYSLGCALYECLTGQTPFEKEPDAAVIFAHVQESPVPPTTLRPDLSPAIDEVFARVLAKQPGDRYGSCREFIEAARTALVGTGAAPQSLGSPARTGGRLAVDPLPDNPAQKVAVGALAARARQGDTVASRRRQPVQAPSGDSGEPDGCRPSPDRAAAALVRPAGLDRGADRAGPGRRGLGYLSRCQRRAGVRCDMGFADSPTNMNTLPHVKGGSGRQAALAPLTTDGCRTGIWITASGADPGI